MTDEWWNCLTKSSKRQLFPSALMRYFRSRCPPERLPDSSQQSVLMRCREDGSYAGTLELRGAGGYAAALTWQDEQGEALDAREAAFAHSWSAEYEALAGTDGTAALTAICAATGGVLSENMQALAQPDAASAVREMDALPPLSLLVFACLMAELILRKRSRG